MTIPLPSRLHPLLLLLLIVLGVGVTSVMAVPVEVSIGGDINGSVSYLAYEKNVTGTQEFTVQWYNLASASCRTRMEFVIYNTSTYTNQVDVAWTEGKPVHPGASRAFRAYWLPNQTGVYSATLRIHNCFDIVEKRIGNFTVTDTGTRRKVIDLTVENKPNSKVAATLTANRSVENVRLIPVDQPLGWAFPGRAAGSLEPGETVTIPINYTPSAWSREDVSYRAVSSDGRFTSPPVTTAVEREHTAWERHGTRVLVSIILFLYLTLLIVVTRR